MCQDRILRLSSDWCLQASVGWRWRPFFRCSWAGERAIGLLRMLTPQIWVMRGFARDQGDGGVVNMAVVGALFSLESLSLLCFCNISRHVVWLHLNALMLPTKDWVQQIEVLLTWHSIIEICGCRGVRDILYCMKGQLSNIAKISPTGCHTVWIIFYCIMGKTKTDYTVVGHKDISWLAYKATIYFFQFSTLCWK